MIDDDRQYNLITPSPQPLTESMDEQTSHQQLDILNHSLLLNKNNEAIQSNISNETPNLDANDPLIKPIKIGLTLQFNQNANIGVNHEHN